MRAHTSAAIVVNDVLDELNHENAVLRQQLAFGSQCELILQKLIHFLSAVYHKLELRDDERQQLIDLQNEYQSYINERLASHSVDNDENCADNGLLVGVKLEQQDHYEHTDELKFGVSSADDQCCPNGAKRSRKKRKKRNENEDEINLFGSQYSQRLSTSKVNELREKTLKCPHPGCGKMYRNTTLLNLHVRFVHELKRTIACEYYDCGKLFRTKGEMRKHMLIHSDEKPFECDICHFRVRTKTARDAHKQTHNIERRYECSFSDCGKRFKTESTLKGHMLSHSVSPPLKCNFGDCEAGFRTYRALGEHKSKVHGTNCRKEYVCDWPACEFRTKTGHNLNIHKSIHTGEKKYLCNWPGCESRFRARKYLYEHLKIHRGDKKFKCGLCDYCCVNKSNLKKHIKIHEKRMNELKLNEEKDAIFEMK